MTKVWQTLKNETSMNGTQFRRKNENLSSSADVLPKTSNLVISRFCFDDDGKELDKDEKMLVQSVQNYCFCPLNMQICGVLVTVAVVIAQLPIGDLRSATLSSTRTPQNNNIIS